MIKMSKVEMYNRIKRYVNDENLKELNVRSKQYVPIMKAKYSKNEESNEMYSIISFDFNKLNDFNKQYGEEKGDKVIYDVLEVIMGSPTRKGILPKDAECARMGGDEFFIILPNTELTEAEIYRDQMVRELEKEKEKLLGMTVCPAAVSSEFTNNLDKMLDMAENLIHSRKIHQNNGVIESHKENVWENIRNYLNANFHTFFKSLRLHQDTLSIEELKAIYQMLVETMMKRVEKHEERQKPITLKKYEESPIRNEASKIHDLLLKRNATKEEIEEIDEEDYVLFLDKIVREKNTGKFSKQYFHSYLLGEKEKKCKVICVSLANVKLLNSYKNYETTNEEIRSIMKEIGDIIKEVQKEDGRFVFSEEAFPKEEKNIVVDFGGGDFVIPVDENLPIEVLLQKIIEYVEIFNQKEFKDSLLRIAVSQEYAVVDKDNAEEIVTKMIAKAKKTKDVFTHQLIKQNEIMEPIMGEIFYGPLQMFKKMVENEPDKDSDAIMQDKQKFINLIAQVGLNAIVDFNEEQNKLVSMKRKSHEVEER